MIPRIRGRTIRQPDERPSELRALRLLLEWGSGARSALHLPKSVRSDARDDRM